MRTCFEHKSVTRLLMTSLLAVLLACSDKVCPDTAVSVGGRCVPKFDVDSGPVSSGGSARTGGSAAHSGGANNSGGSGGTGGSVDAGDGGATGGANDAGDAGGAVDAGVDGSVDANVDAGTVPCNGACKGTTPICDESSDTCVECTGDGDCSSEYCLDHACVECRSNADCDATSKLVCDSALHSCVMFTNASANVCEPCVADAQCQEGQLCVMQTFGATPGEKVGYFCMWDSTSALGSVGCSNHPYASMTASVTSIDALYGATSTVCTLAFSTCLAFADNGKDCGDGKASPSGLSELCGYSHSAEDFTTGANVDAYCVDVAPTGSPSFICASVCSSAANGSNYCDTGTMCATVDGHRVCVPQ